MQRAAKTHVASLDRDHLQDRFLEVRSLSEKLVEPLTTDDTCVAVTDETSPPKWHLAHTTWFFEHFLLGRDPGYQPLDPSFDFLFNSYYRTVGNFNPKPERRHMARPSFAEVLQYRAAIDERVLALLQKAPEHEVESLREILTLGWNHEQQHQELLLMDIKRNFFVDPARPAYREQSPLRRVGEGQGPAFTSYVGGLFEVGAKRGGFTYDNEHGRHTVWLEPFALADDLVTNRQFLAFVEDGGYLSPALWLSDGWDWLEQTKARAPLYWERHGNSWQEMTLYGMRELDPEAPVAHVNYYEAQAFARWMHARLPTEFEWEYAAARHELSGQFLEQNNLHPEATAGIPKFHGRLWQWTQSSYLPYPRYEAPSGSLAEYNGKFFCNQMVLRGGACVTPRSHYRTTYRNFYYPHMRWQFAGIRLAKDCPC